MEFFNPKSNVNFMGIRRWTVLVSLLLIATSIGSLAIKGLNLSLDFTGGALEKAGIHHAIVQRFDSTNVAIRLDPSEVARLASQMEKSTDSSLDTRDSKISESLQSALT